MSRIDIQTTQDIDILLTAENAAQILTFMTLQYWSKDVLDMYGYQCMEGVEIDWERFVNLTDPEEYLDLLDKQAQDELEEIWTEVANNEVNGDIRLWEE